MGTLVLKLQLPVSNLVSQVCQPLLDKGKSFSMSLGYIQPLRFFFPKYSWLVISEPELGDLQSL